MSYTPGLLGLSAAASLAAAAAGTFAWAGLSPQSQIFGPTLVAPPSLDQLALTFDDGPNPTATPRLLELLAQHQVRATFFLIGEYVLREPRLTREIHAAGHVIGNHTMHHAWLPRYSLKTIRDEMRSANQAIEDTIGVRVDLFRPPHGSRRPAVFRAAAELGLEIVMWNLIVGDWIETRSAATLLGSMRKGITRHRSRGTGTNLVLHDGNQYDPAADRVRTVQAVAALLKELPRGVRLVTPRQWEGATIEAEASYVTPLHQELP